MFLYLLFLAAKAWWRAANDKPTPRERCEFQVFGL